MIQWWSMIVRYHKPQLASHCSRAFVESLQCWHHPLRATSTGTPRRSSSEIGSQRNPTDLWVVYLWIYTLPALPQCSNSEPPFFGSNPEKVQYSPAAEHRVPMPDWAHCQIWRTSVEKPPVPPASQRSPGSKTAVKQTSATIGNRLECCLMP